MYKVILCILESEYKLILPLGEGVKGYSVFHRDPDLLVYITNSCAYNKLRIEYTPTTAKRMAYIINRLEDEDLKNIEFRKATFKGANEVWVLKEGKD